MPLASAIAAVSFTAWAHTHGKQYATREELVLRRAVFAANVAKIEKHNAEAAAGLHTWTQGVNQFTDLTADEFKATRMSGIKNANKPRTHINESLLQVTALPDSVDWTTKGAVTPVKDQGQCGSCWAFSTTGSTEGAVFLKTGTLLSLSEQQLMDCSQKEGNESCNGGLMDDAFQYIIDNKGIGSEASYPYEAKDDKCRTVPSVATIVGFTDVPANSDTALMTAIVQQPISVAIEADQAVFQSYKSGVMTGKCGTQLDHGVLAVGYGTDAGQDYYKVKNSWGLSWGEQGFIRMGRGTAFAPNGQCGILMMSSYPTE
jgi:C1A family cysteine protease